MPHSTLSNFGYVKSGMEFGKILLDKLIVAVSTDKKIRSILEDSVFDVRTYDDAIVIDFEFAPGTDMTSPEFLKLTTIFNQVTGSDGRRHSDKKGVRYEWYYRSHVIMARTIELSDECTETAETLEDGADGTK